MTMKDLFFGLNPYTFTGSATIIGLILVNEITPGEQVSIGNWLQLIGLTIQTYASQVANLQAENNSCQENSTDLDTLRKAIDKIKEELDHFSECQKGSGT